MTVPYIILTLFLIFTIRRISCEQCVTTNYKEPVLTFRVSKELIRICGFNGVNEVSHSVVNNTSGEINFIISLNGTLCDGEYIFEIFNNDLNDLHTQKSFVVCTECGNSSVGFLQNAGKLIFNVMYVFSGSYHLTLKSKNFTIDWKSRNFEVNTNYNLAKLEDLSKSSPVVSFLALSKKKNILEVKVELNKTIFSKLPSYEIFAVPPDRYDYKTDLFCYGNNMNKTCDSVAGGYQRFCNYEFNVTTGEYRIFVKIDDPRCNSATLWMNNSECGFWKSFSIVVENKPPTPKPPPLVGSTQKIVIICVVSAAIVVCAVFLLVKRLRIRARTNRNSIGARYNPIQTTDEREFFIVYARELDQFERVVDALKRLLVAGNSNKSKVTTLYTLDSRCSDPKRWLQKKLRDEHVTIILFLNVASTYARDTNYMYKMLNCFDPLFPYALQLLQSDERRSYHNLFKVLAPGANEEEYRLVNTLTSYNVPQHIHELVMDLHVGDGDEIKDCEEVFKNECNTYRDCVENRDYLRSIFVKKVFL